jgi:FtsH-binding integral membrane protein
MAVAAETVIFLGFSRTYYLKFHYPTSPSLSLFVHVHAVVFTSWMIYFIVQTLLIAVRRPALHRSLGVLGAVLGTAVIGMGLLVAVVAMRLGHGNLAQSPEVIFLVSLIDIGSFALFFVLGYLRRRDREAHQRLMLMAVIIGLTGAGLGRLTSLGVSIPVISVINFALLFAGPLYDLLTRRRIHFVYRWAIPYALATFTPLRFLVGATSWWNHVAHWLVGM